LGLPFPDRLSCIAQGFTNVFYFEVRVSLQNFGFGYPFPNHSDHGSNGNAQTTNARSSAHLIDPNCNSRKLHDSLTRLRRKKHNKKDNTSSDFQHITPKRLRIWRLIERASSQV